MSDKWWEYNKLEPRSEWHEEASKGPHPHDNIDFHIDLGGGYLPKGRINIDRHEEADIQMDLDTGKIFGWKEKFENRLEINNSIRKDIKRVEYIGPAPDTFISKHGILPFPDNSIESVVTHHCLEHIGEGFVPLIDDVYRVLKPGGIFRIIVPMFPSMAMYEDQDHKRLFGPKSFVTFVGNDDGSHWHESFAKPYTKSRFLKHEVSYTPPTSVTITEDNTFKITEPDGNFRHSNVLSCDDFMPKAREMRVSLTK